MPTITVEKCCECPLRDTSAEDEWSEYDCEFGPDPQPHPDGKGVVFDSIRSGTEEPPRWCPLRRDSFVIHGKPSWHAYDKENPDGS